MARIILGSYAVRFPMGGYLSWVLQWLVGFARLGHDVYFVEKAGWDNSCFDPTTGTMGNDCSYGVRALNDLLKRFDLQEKWCFVDAAGNYHGLGGNSIERVFNTADLFIDMGTHGAWMGEAENTNTTVLLDGEPGTTQMRMESKLAAGDSLPEYDFYYTVGRNIGTDRTSVPSAGRLWRPVFFPVSVDLYQVMPPPDDAPFSTVMSWQAYEPIRFGGKIYGQKDVEFMKFAALPRLANAPLEIAVAGENVPADRLRQAGWRVKDAHGVSLTFDSFNDYIHSSKGEFSVCKNVFVETNSGWFGDRSAVYLACGRPVVMQETGFSDHLPCGTGLFAVRTAEEAAAAIEQIVGDYDRHSQAARDIAHECLDTHKVLRQFLNEVGS